MLRLLNHLDAKAFDRIDEDWRDRIKEVDDPEADLAYEYTSSSGKRVYRLQLHKEGSSWYGSCSCPAGGRKRGEPAPLCKHLAAALLLQPEFDTRADEPVEEEEKKPAMVEATPPAPVQTEKIIWPSAVPMIETCPASMEEADIKIDMVGEPARIGRAVHSICQEIVEKDLHNIPALKPYALENNIEVNDDLRFLAYSALKLWQGSKEQKGLKEYFRNPLCEVTNDFTFSAVDPTGNKAKIRIHGRADVFETFEDHAVVLDWKSGRKHDDYSYLGQMKALAILAAAQDKRIQRVSTIIAWLRDGVVSPIVTFTRQELKEWLKGFVKHDLFWDGKTYRPGPHCRFCPRYLNCPARKAILENAIATFSDPSVVESRSLLADPEKLAIALQQAQMVSRVAEDFIAQAKEFLDGKDPVPIPDKPGYTYAVVEGQGRTAIDPIAAWPILAKHLSEDELASCVAIKTGKVRSALADKASSGSKKQYIEEVMNEMEANGALIKGQPTKSLRVIRIEEE